MSNETRKALEKAIEDHARDKLDGTGSIIHSWIVLCGVVNGNGAGGVLNLVSDDGLPLWQAKGMLTDSLDSLREMRNADAED